MRITLDLPETLIKKAMALTQIPTKTRAYTGTSDAQNDYLMINSRHFTLLQNALDALTRTKEILKTGDSDEIACFEATNAQISLNEILGIDVKQDILDTIFSTFCIGK